MGRLFVAASTQRVENSGVPFTAKPLTMSCWVKPTTTTGTQYLFSLYSMTTFPRVWALGSVTGTPFILERGSSAGQANAASAMTAGSWAHVAGTLASGATANRFCYLNGVAGTVNNTSVPTPAVPERTGAGSVVLASGPTYSNYFDGIIAELALYNVDLSAAEVASLARGVSPLRIRPGNLKFYAPLFGTGSPEPDYTAGQHPLSLTNAPTTAAHPPSKPMVIGAEA